MKFSISGLVLISSIASILATPVAQDSIQGSQISQSEDSIQEQDDQADAGSIQKRGYRGRHRGHHRGHYRGYRNFGRVWYFDSQPDTVFISQLRYRPSNFYGQRFEYCYQNIPEFRQYWDTDIAFRQSWDQDIHFRNSWFAILYPYGYEDYRD
ncbi:hypothetical protein AYI70_g9913, partial [Smittium culicis]